MLDTIKKLIEKPCISFGEFFQQYVMYVQDESIKQEISFLLKNNFLSSNAMIRLVNEELEGRRGKHD